jgi:hypothetical protein
MKYIVSFRLSRTQWVVPSGRWTIRQPPVETLEEAIELASGVWRNEIDKSAYVDVRIEKQMK